MNSQAKVNNKRRLSRHELVFYLLVLDLNSGQELGRMIDLNASGILLMGDLPLSPGSTFDMTMQTPKSFAANGVHEVRLRGQVMWTRPDANQSGLMQSGIKFIDPDPEEQWTIRQLIDLCGMPMPHQEEDDDDDEVEIVDIEHLG